MVGGDDVDRAIGEAEPNRFSIGIGAQGWIHFEDRVKTCAALIGQGEVMWCCLGGHSKPVGLGLSDEFDRPGGRDVLEMQGDAGELAQQFDITSDDDVFRSGWTSGDPQPGTPLPFMHVTPGHQGWIFRVLSENSAFESSEIFEGTSHDDRASDTIAVIGEETHTTVVERSERCELLTLSAAGDRR